MINTDGESGVDTDPEYVVVAGDWHGDNDWAVGVIHLLPAYLPEVPEPLLLHVGDFGVQTDREDYLDAVDEALARVKGKLLFVDGNHDKHPALHALLGDDPTAPVRVRRNIVWLPRGHRWTWHGKTWVALGGAASIDRAQRFEGYDWWPEETITPEQADLVKAAGPAHVMLCHDIPDGVPLRLRLLSGSWPLRDIARSERHREVLRDVVNVVKPELIVHGHYHLEHDTVTDLGYGPVRVVGLDKNGAVAGNVRVLDVRTLTFPAGRVALPSKG